MPKELSNKSQARPFDCAQGEREWVTAPGERSRAESNPDKLRVSGRETRRSFLAKLGLGAAVLAAVSALPFLRPGKGLGSTESSGGFPGEDSIFHPAQDPRQDPRRR